MSSLIASQGSGKEFTIHPAGPTAARCTRIIDLGTQDGEFEGKAKKTHKVAFAFESAVLMGDDEGDFAGKPFLISQQFTLSLGEKANLRKFLEGWRGRPFTPAELEAFDLRNVLGKPCFLGINHSDPNKSKTKKVYANIASIMTLPAQITMPAAVGGLTFFTLSEFDQAAYDGLSEYYQELIAKSDEYKAMKAGLQTPPGGAPAKSAADNLEDDDIPF